MVLPVELSSILQEFPIADGVVGLFVVVDEEASIVAFEALLEGAIDALMVGVKLDPLPVRDERLSPGQLFPHSTSRADLPSKNWSR